MAEYIEREAFLADKKWLYCTDCDKRKGKKRGKTVTLYEIGEAPCKSCGVHDMLEEVEVYPAADVREVVLCRDCKNRFMTPNGWRCHYVEWAIEDDDYCSCGERKDGAEMKGDASDD